MKLTGLRVAVVLAGLLCALAWPLSSFCQTAQPTPIPVHSKIIIPEPIFDFGTITQGTKVTHDFVVHNEGSGDLVIQRVVPGCGCTAATIGAPTILPGGNGTVHVEFDSSGFSGEKLKTVRVLSNDMDEPSKMLTIKGVVLPDVSIDPAVVNFDEVVRGTPAEKTAQVVTVKVRPGSEVKLGEYRAYSPNLLVTELEKSDKVLRLSVAINPDAPLGEIRDRIILSLSGGRASSMNIPIFALVQGPLSLDPPQLSFGVIQGTQPISRSVKLLNRGEQGVEIKSLHSNNSAVSAALKTIEAGKTYVIQVSVDPKKVVRDLKAAVEVVTDSKDENAVLNVYGILPPKVDK